MNKLLPKISSLFIWCSVLFAIFSHVELYAQSQISGKVVDSTGEPIIGATVAYDKGTKGVATGLDGTFRIDAGAGTEVVISYIGYQSVYAKTSPDLVVTMKQDDTTMDEVIVVGYGSIKSRELAGSVGVVNMDDLQDVAMTSIDQALEGRVTGLAVVSSDGQPGSEASIVIRGVGSMDDASPLFVIDGFPQEESDFTTLNPNDIESMTVLKDAASTAIYGSRGANGVIIVTTKRGQEGTPTIAYNGNISLIRATKTMEVMDPQTFVKMQADIVDQYYVKQLVGAGGARYNSWIQDETYYTGGKTYEDYADAPFIDWVDMMSNDNPIQQNHTISISGRKNNSGYYISLNYADQEGLLVNSGFTRYQGRLSVDQFVTDNIKVGLNANFASTNTFGDTATSGSSAGNALMNRVYQSRPTSWDENSFNDLLYDFVDNGSEDIYGNSHEPWAGGSTQFRYHAITNSMNTDNRKRLDALTANAYLEFTFLKKALKLRVSGGYTNKRTTNYTFYLEETSSGHSEGSDKGANGSFSEYMNFSLLNENTLTYTKVFKAKHSLNAILGFSAQENKTENYNYTAEEVPDEQLGVSSLKNGVITSTDSGRSVNALLSVFGRVNYSYKSKYIANFTMRRDGSSKFAEGNKWGTFPSGAFAWRLSEEKFMSSIKKTMNDARIRVSYGISGNNRVNDFQSQATITTSTNERYAFGNTLYTYGSYPSQLANDELTWETTRTLNVGTDLAFFKNRVKVEFDFYTKNTHDLLLNASLPTNSGFSSVRRNIGQINNTGYEISLNTTNINKKGFRWTTTINFSFNKNELVSLSSGEEAITTSVSYIDDAAYIARVGEPVAQFYGYINEGMYQYSDFKIIESLNTYAKADRTYAPYQYYLLKDNVPYATSKITTLPGFLKHKDLNNDGSIDDDDYTVIGSPYPKHVGSISNRFSYKGFDLNVYFTWSYGSEILNGTRLQMYNVGDGRACGLNRYAYLADYWSDDNPNAKYPSIVTTSTLLRSNSTNYLEDGSYLRLKTVTLSYTIPKKFVTKLGLKNVRISYTGNNLWTLTNYSGQDPEVNVNYTALTPSYDNASYPRTSTNSLGLSITL